jgi:hypothetical protein
MKTHRELSFRIVLLAPRSSVRRSVVCMLFGLVAWLGPAIGGNTFRAANVRAEKPGTSAVMAPEEEALPARRPSGEPIVEVRVEGWQTIPPEAILRLVKTQPGRPATERQVQDDVRALWGTRWFVNVGAGV